MKYLVLLVFAVALIESSSSAGMFSSFSSGLASSTNAVRGVAINTVKGGVNAAAIVRDTTVSTAGNLMKSVSTAALNGGISVFLETVRAFVSSSHLSSLPIKEIHQKIGPATFDATQGYFRDLSTIVKDGPANVTMNGTSIIIDIPLKLANIDIGYDQFTASMLMLKFGGGIGIHIAEDSFAIRLRLTPGFNCAVNLEKVFVKVLAKISIDFHNMGKKSDWFMNKVANGIVTLLKQTIKRKVQDAIDRGLRDVIQQNGRAICSNFLG